MEKLKKYWSYIFIGIMISGGIIITIFEIVKKEELSDLNSFRILIAYGIIFIVDSLVNFNKNHKIISLLGLAIIIFLGVKFSIEMREILSTVYNDEINRKIDISFALKSCKFFVSAYFIRLSLLGYLEAKKEMN